MATKTVTDDKPAKFNIPRSGSLVNLETSNEGECHRSKLLIRFAQCIDVAKLQQLISKLDMLSQKGFDAIDKEVVTAQEVLAAPPNNERDQRLAQAFEAIQDKAFEVMNAINGFAEELGCNHVSGLQRQDQEVPANPIDRGTIHA